MSALRIIAPVMTAALAVGGLATAASAAPAADSASRAAVDQCRLRIEKVRVLDLQHDQTGTDHVFAEIGNSVTDTLSYTLPQTRNTLGTGEELFSGTATVRLMVDFGPGFLPVGSDTVPCQNTTRDFVFDNGDARYKVRALVQVLP